MAGLKNSDEITVLVPEAPVDIQNDEFRGVGGSYIFNPATGKRTPASSDSAGPTEQPVIEQPVIEQPKTEIVSNESE